MTANPVRAKRYRALEKLGFDYVGNLYLRLGGVRQLMNSLFESHGGENVNTAHFYYWLDKGNHRDKWYLVQAQRLKDKYSANKHDEPYVRAMFKNELNEKRKKEPLTWTMIFHED